MWRAKLDGDGPYLLLGLVADYLCFLWYVADSAERGFRRPRRLGAAMILLTPVAVPWCLMRTRAGRARMGLARLCRLRRPVHPDAWGGAALRLRA